MKKGKRLSKIIGYFLNILIILVTIIILIGIYYIVQIKVLNYSYANLFGYTFFEVATGSMSSTIEIGDVVIVKITKDVSENDIIVYKENDNFITHRLIKKENNTLIAKGDANNSEDKPITEEQILGQVIKIIPKIGIWRKVILSPEVLILIFIVIVLLSLIFAHDSKSKEMSEKRKDNKNE